MKKLLILSVMIIALVLAFTSCNLFKTVELEFTSNGDGTCYVSGIGSCTDTDIIIPSTSPDGDSVTSIGDWAFEDCTSLTDVYYTGSKEDWAKIEIGDHNSPLKNANIHYNYVPEE